MGQSDLHQTHTEYEEDHHCANCSLQGYEIGSGHGWFFYSISILALNQKSHGSSEHNAVDASSEPVQEPGEKMKT